MSGPRLVEAGPLAVGRDAIDDAFFTGGGVQEPLAIGRQRPDVALARLEEGGRLPAAIDLVDLSVWRGRHVQAAVRRRRDRVRLELRGVEERRPFALPVDLEDPAFIPGPDKQRPVASRHQRPDKRRRGFVDELGRLAEQQLPSTVDRQVLDVALEKIGLRRGKKELRRRGLGRDDRSEEQPERKRGSEAGPKDQPDAFVSSARRQWLASGRRKRLAWSGSPTRRAWRCRAG